MLHVTLGSTGITVNKNGFGALPIQRISKEDAIRLLRQAFDGGINFFDTARAYSDSEEKLGAALSGVRERIFIATKTAASAGDELKSDLETSLRLLQTDHVDIYQFHNPVRLPRPGDGSGLYEAALEAKATGKIRHIGVTNHRLRIAQEAVESGLYETLQFPFNYLSSPEEQTLPALCRAHNMGFLAMKALSGGLITNSGAAYAWQAGQPDALPIWGIQRDRELMEFLSYQDQTPPLDEEQLAKDRAELAGAFCRACGYCMPCPVGIEINTCARMSLLMRRAPTAAQLTPEMQEKMAKIKDCLHCYRCAKKCPYGLDTPKLLEENYRDYLEVLAGKPL